MCLNIPSSADMQMKGACMILKKFIECYQNRSQGRKYSW